MFQSFTGNSRRPRQVDLSGRNTNPFAALPGSRNPSIAQGSQNALAQAQQERVLRQQERDRFNTAKVLQRTWRGYRSRQELKRQWRYEWDNRESTETAEGPYGTEEDCFIQLRLLLHFTSLREQDDIRRFHRFGKRLCRTFDVFPEAFTGDKWSAPLTRLARLALKILNQGMITFHEDSSLNDVLMLLISVVLRVPKQMAQYSREYYRALGIFPSTVCLQSHETRALLDRAVMALLQSGPPELVQAYEGFAQEYLSMPNVTADIGVFGHIADDINAKLLARAINNLTSPASKNPLFTSKRSEQLLWLLAKFIHLCRRAQEMHGKITEPPDAEYISAISRLLSCLADEIEARIELPLTSSANQLSDSRGPRYSDVPLPEFVRQEVMSLVNKEVVSSLLRSSELVSVPRNHEARAAREVSVLASYALMLLRVFPRKGNDIRMWLYLGSASDKSARNDLTGHRIPAIKYFWQSASTSKTYELIRQDPSAAVKLLKPYTPDGSAGKVDAQIEQEGRDQEWRVILLFLELYIFVLRVMDDDEFFSGKSNIKLEHQSWTRESALSLESVEDLTKFLKNLAFTMYWRAADFSASASLETRNSIASYFAAANSSSAIRSDEESSIQASDITIAGVAGMSVSYVKGMVTGLLRMIYERDSRRHFLPQDHWLMTKHFDMESFIRAVVSEEENRHQVQEADEDDGDHVDATFDQDMTDEDGLIGTQRTQQARRIERVRHQQRKASRRKYLELVTPRLEILQNMPFFIPFTTRVQIFREFVTLDQERRRNGFIDADLWRMSQMRSSAGRLPDVISKHHAKVRRDSIFEDAFAQFYELGDGLKEPIQITFIDRFDTVEAGIDGGGVTKEFLTSICNEAFSPQAGLNLFIDNDQHLLYPNPSAVDERKDMLRQAEIKEGSPDWNTPIRNLLQRYEFLGRIIGKCLYEGILVDIHFAGFFLLKWALTGGSGSAGRESGYRASINDLRDLDEGLYQGLLQLKNYPGNVEDFSLNFTVTDTLSASTSEDRVKTVTRDLQPNGSNISVTNENRLMYISYIARHRLQNQPRQQTNEFLRGLGQVIQPTWLSMFNQSELQTLIGGDTSEIDISDLRANTLYGGVYVIGDDNLEHPSIQLFWQVMQSFSDGDRRKVLKFVTSTPRSPLLGFNQLNPRFSIRDAGDDQTRLPSTSTCVNLLKLPRYSESKTLRTKLLYAVNAGAGFDLS